MGRWLKWGGLAVLVLGLLGGGFVYLQAFTDNVNPALSDDYALLIPRGTGFETVMKKLEADKVLSDPGSFRRVASFRSYDNLVKPGRYEIKKGTNNWDLVTKLRAGDQDQMKLRFGTQRMAADLAKEISTQVDINEAELLKKMQDDNYLKKYGVNSKTFRNLFIPNTYFVYWTLSIDDLFQKMKKNFDGYWNSDRKQKAEKLGMSIHEVVTLASIVQAETYLADERPRVAGLYLNRIRDHIPLQADPTVIFAVGDFSIRRVLKRHLEFDSPYNTYKFTGLPPGPINNPETTSIDAVLNYEKHNYIFMCAKADFSGYHNFAKTLAQHNRNAREYQRALNKQKVYK
ncbi:MAG: endolytic transglycosylase MltG [Bacteroidota bacterium]